MIRRARIVSNREKRKKRISSSDAVDSTRISDPMPNVQVATHNLPPPPKMVTNPIVEVVPWESPCPCRTSRRQFQDCCLRNLSTLVPEAESVRLKHQLCDPGFIIIMPHNKHLWREYAPGRFEAVKDYGSDDLRIN